MSDHAAIYIADPSILDSRLFDQIDGILSYEGLSEGDSATGFRLMLEAGQVRMNFMPQEQVAKHLEGFAGYAETVITDKDLLLYTRSRIYYVRLVCGCVITPGFDDDGKIEEFLFQFNCAVNGLLFFADTIFDYDGESLGGNITTAS